MASGRGGDVNNTPLEPLRSPAASPDRLSERDRLEDSLEGDFDKKKKSEDIFAKPKISGSRQVRHFNIAIYCLCIHIILFYVLFTYIVCLHFFTARPL